MSKQQPLKPLDEIMREHNAARGWEGSGPGRPVPVIRERVMPGETPAAAKARWAREREIERARRLDPRLGVSGRVLPIRYDE